MALDDGGARGFSQLIILAQIVHRIMTEMNLKEEPRPCKIYKVIGGAGSGG